MLRTMKPVGAVCGLMLMLFGMTACSGGTEVAQVVPTSTLAPLVTLTPRFTATPLLTRTPLPTATLTPSETPIPPTPTISPTPSPTPPVIGIISSLQSVNVRRGPSASEVAFAALDAGTRVEVLGTNVEATWLNVQLEDGREGWVSAALVRLEPTPTPFPTLGPTVDMTAAALGTPLPTAVIGGGTVTPTPPRSAVTATPPGEAATAAPTDSISAGTPFLPIIDPSFNATATALVAGAGTIPATSAATSAATAASTAAPGTPTAATVETARPPVAAGTATVQIGTDVLAYCDNPFFGSPAPTDLAAGSRIDLFWGWYARTREQVQQHVDNVIYDVRVNDQPITQWRNYASPVNLEGDGNYHIYWFVPVELPEPGEYTISYRVTWRNQITDGYRNFGPGTGIPSETGSCTFRVR
jgi:hypothetical protein